MKTNSAASHGSANSWLTLGRLTIVARLSAARLVLERLQKQLAQMTKAYAAAEEHLSKLTVDEASVEKVVRDSPM